MMLLKLAARNLLRHTRRTVITGLGIALGLAMMLIANNIGNGSRGEMIRLAVSQMAGHVVVQAEGYQDDPKPETLIAGATPLAEQLRGAFPEAKVTRRSLLVGLLSSTTNSMGVGVSAVDPVVEAEVTDWEDKLVEGDWLEDDRGILLGARLAESLDVELGDKVVLMVQGVDEVSNRMFRVRGLLRTGVDEIDGFVALAHVDAGAEMLGVEDAAHQVALHLSDPEQTEAATAEAAALLSGRAGLEVLPWKKAVPEMYEMVRLDTLWGHVMMGLIGFILALGVLNTVLMSVMERVKEFGVMLALGTSPARLASLVVFEGAVLGAISTALGFALATAICEPWVQSGLDYSAFMGGDAMAMGEIAMSTQVPVVHDWGTNLLYAVAAVALVILASLYPAVRASRLQPVDAMRHV